MQKKKTSVRKKRTKKTPLPNELVKVTTYVGIAIAGGFQKMEHARSVEIMVPASRIPEAGVKGLEQAIELYKEGAEEVFRLTLSEIRRKASKLREKAEQEGLL